ncbi:hypothetical protein [Marinilactibacillus kalidii]|uniref:hypothetical protein n=1 Tax=Marinilactibacillus kalidii TaxID=2820274 RepID=UPI001ABE16D5|nr:hypothetical protein [Marinilactibacillus kalidii]
MVNVKLKRENSDKEKSTEITDITVLIREKRFGYRTVADLERKRPRNHNEKRQLKQWEKERGGKKIGKI